MEERAAFIVVYLTDGDVPRWIRWSEVVGVTDRSEDKAEPHYVLYLSNGNVLAVKEQSSFPVIHDRLKDME